MTNTNNQQELNADLIMNTLKRKGYHCIFGGKYRGNAEYIFAHPTNWLQSTNPLERHGSFLAYQPDLEHRQDGRPLLSLVIELRKNKKLKFAFEIGTAMSMLPANGRANPNPNANQAIMQLRENLIKDLGLEDLITQGLFNNNKPTSSCRIFNLNSLFNDFPAVSEDCDPIVFENKIDEALSFLKNINTNIDEIKNKSVIFSNNSKPKQGRNLKYLDVNQFKQNNLTF